MNIKWDAPKYTSNFSFVPNYGRDLIAMISAEKGSKVLDLGCGNGTLSKALKEEGFKVTGLDGSEELLSIAKENYPEIKFIKDDARYFELPESYDVIFSNAVFHWIDKKDQEKMLKQVHKALKKNGEFIFEFGGFGNNKLIHPVLEQIFNKYGYEYKMPFYFPTIGEYASLLEEAGFLVTYATLFDRPTKLEGKDGLKDWIKMFIKTPFDKVDPEDEEKIIDDAVEALRDDLFIDNNWYSDYVRLRMKAIRI